MVEDFSVPIVSRPPEVLLTRSAGGERRANLPLAQGEVRRRYGAGVAFAVWRTFRCWRSSCTSLSPLPLDGGRGHDPAWITPHFLRATQTAERRVERSFVDKRAVLVCDTPPRGAEGYGRARGRAVRFPPRCHYAVISGGWVEKACAPPREIAVTERGGRAAHDLERSHAERHWTGSALAYIFVACCGLMMFYRRAPFAEGAGFFLCHAGTSSPIAAASNSSSSIEFQ